MAGRLEGKVAIITGAGAFEDGIGNGRAAAILFAREGARVLCVDRQLALAERTCEMIAAEGGAAAPFAADITRQDDCQAMVAEAVSRWGKLDLLDNNVGIGIGGSVVDVSEADWELQMRVNVTGMMLSSKAAIPAMRDAGGGAIVNISSIAALTPSGLTPYATSKGAVISLTKAMAVDHGREGIRVNCIAPGPVYTPMVSSRGQMTDDQRERRRRMSALQTEGTGWDVGYAALFLCSDEAKYITGVVLKVDGGTTIR
ncbi:MAG: glucose 1-dehydrogenase [Dehalococcoidia bacterium]